MGCKVNCFSSLLKALPWGNILFLPELSLTVLIWGLLFSGKGRGFWKRFGVRGFLSGWWERNSLGCWESREFYLNFHLNLWLLTGNSITWGADLKWAVQGPGSMDCGSLGLKGLCHSAYWTAIFLLLNSPSEPQGGPGLGEAVGWQLSVQWKLGGWLGSRRSRKRARGISSHIASGDWGDTDHFSLSEFRILFAPEFSFSWDCSFLLETLTLATPHPPCIFFHIIYLFIGCAGSSLLWVSVF